MRSALIMQCMLASRSSCGWIAAGSVRGLFVSMADSALSAHERVIVREHDGDLRMELFVDTRCECG